MDGKFNLQGQEEQTKHMEVDTLSQIPCLPDDAEGVEDVVVLIPENRGDSFVPGLLL